MKVDTSNLGVSLEDLPRDADTFAEEECERLSHPKHDAYLLVVQMPDHSWRSSFTASLSDGGTGSNPARCGQAFGWRAAAIMHAADELTAWCSLQKDLPTASLKHKRQLEEVQEWALEVGGEQAAELLAAGAIKADLPFPADIPSQIANVRNEERGIGRLEEVALSRIEESPDNPRKYFATGPFEELVRSVRQSGVQVPLILRQLGDRLIIAAGHRRRLAALEAGRETVPAIVREMTDEEFDRILAFENKHRQDLLPLEDAQGMAYYMRRSGATVEEVAKLLGYSLSTAYARLKLLSLTDAAQHACIDGWLEPSSAELIARLTPANQERALAYLHPAHDPDRRITVRGLRKWIAENCHQSLVNCGFDPLDALLLPSAGACSTCPKRAGLEPNLFSDLSEDTCTDGACFGLKRTAAISREREKREEKKRAAEAEKPVPPKVEPSPQAAKPATPDAPKPSLAAQEKAYREHAAEERRKQEAKEAQLQAAVAKEAEIKKRTFHEIVKSICAAAKCPPTQEDLLALVETIIDGAQGCEEVADMFAIPTGGRSRAADIQAVLPLRSTSTDRLLRIGLATVLFDLGATTDWNSSNHMFISLCGRHKIDRIQIGKQVVDEMNPKPAPQPPVAGDNSRLSVPCPQCRAKIGEPCLNYKGQRCHPHGLRKMPPAPKPEKTAKGVIGKLGTLQQPAAKKAEAPKSSAKAKPAAGKPKPVKPPVKKQAKAPGKKKGGKK